MRWGQAGANEDTTDRADTYLPGYRIPTVGNTWRSLNVTEAPNSG